MSQLNGPPWPVTGVALPFTLYFKAFERWRANYNHFGKFLTFYRKNKFVLRYQNVLWLNPFVLASAPKYSLK
jgi:hypothetical protein